MNRRHFIAGCAAAIAAPAAVPHQVWEVVGFLRGAESHTFYHSGSAAACYEAAAAFARDWPNFQCMRIVPIGWH